VVGEGLDIGGPVRDAAVGLEGGETEAGAVGSDDAEVEAASDMVPASGLEARRGKPMEEHERETRLAAIFSVAQDAAVWEGECLIV
jgi:hypothetical protein